MFTAILQNEMIYISNEQYHLIINLPFPNYKIRETLEILNQFAFNKKRIK